MKSANDQVSEWLATASRDDLAALVTHLRSRSIEAAVLAYQYVRMQGKGN